MVVSELIEHLRELPETADVVIRITVGAVVGLDRVRYDRGLVHLHLDPEDRTDLERESYARIVEEIGRRMGPCPSPAVN